MRHLWGFLKLWWILRHEAWADTDPVIEWEIHPYLVSPETERDWFWSLTDEKTTA